MGNWVYAVGFVIVTIIELSCASAGPINDDVGERKDVTDPLVDTSAFQIYLKKLSKDNLNCQGSLERVPNGPELDYQPYVDFVKEYKAKGGAIIIPRLRNGSYILRCLCSNGCTNHAKLSIAIKQDDDELLIALDNYFYGLYVAVAPRMDMTESYKVRSQWEIYRDDKEKWSEENGGEVPFFWQGMVRSHENIVRDHLGWTEIEITPGEYAVTSKFSENLICPGFIENIRLIANIVPDLCSVRVISSGRKREKRHSMDTWTDSRGDEYILTPVPRCSIFYKLGSRGFDSKYINLLASLYEKYLRDLISHIKSTHHYFLIKDYRDIPITKLCGKAIFDKLHGDIEDIIMNKNEDAEDAEEAIKNWNVTESTLWSDLLNDEGLFIHLMMFRDNAETSDTIMKKIKTRFSRKCDSQGEETKRVQICRDCVQYRRFHFKSKLSSTSETVTLYPIIEMIDTETSEIFEIEMGAFVISGGARDNIQKVLDNQVMHDPVDAEGIASSLFSILSYAIKNREVTIPGENSTETRHMELTPQNDNDSDDTNVHGIDSAAECDTNRHINQAHSPPTTHTPGGEDENDFTPITGNDTHKEETVDIQIQQNPTHQPSQPLNKPTDGTVSGKSEAEQTQGYSTTNNQDINSHFTGQHYGSLLTISIAGMLIPPALSSCGLSLKKYRKWMAH